MKFFRSYSSVLFIFSFVLLPSLALSQETKWYPFFTKLTGFVDAKGVTVIPPKYDNVGYFSEGLAWIALNLKYGFIDEKGRVVIEPQYDSAERFGNGTAKVERDGKFGLVDKTGKEVLPLRYDDCRGFENGMAAVRTGALWGFVDETGQEKIAPQYDQVQDFSDGLAGVEVKGKWGYINQEGVMLLQPQYGAVCPFSEGKAFVSQEESNVNFSLIDKTGKAVSTITMYTDNQPQLHNGYALFSRCSGAPQLCTFILVDRNGKEVFNESIQYKPPPEYNPDQTPITEVSVDKLTPAGKSSDAIIGTYMGKTPSPDKGLQKVRSAKTIRFFDQNGKVVPGQEYEGDSCEQLSPGSYWIKNGGQITLVENDRSIPLTIDVSHMTLNFNFGEGLVAFTKKVKNPLYGTTDDPDIPVTIERTGFFDKTGKMLAGPQYDELEPMSDGLARFRKDGKEGFVRADGIEVIPSGVKVQSLGNFSEGLALIKVDGRWGYINAKGETVVAPVFTDAGPFQDGFALVHTVDPMVVETIDLHGGIIAKFPNYYLERFREGLAKAYDKEKKRSGYIDKKGKWVIPPVFSWVADFSEGLAFVSVKGGEGEKCGFIDEKGAFRFPPYKGNYWTDGFKNGLAILSGPNGSFVIDKTGKMILENNNRSETVTFDKTGLILLWNQSGLMKFYDRTGKLLFTNCFSEY